LNMGTTGCRTRSRAWMAGEAWAYIGGQWVQVDSTDVGVNGSVFTQEDLQAAFPGTPTASRVHF